MLIAEQHPALKEQEIEPVTKVFKVCWTFDVRADSQEEANDKIYQHMVKFTEMMGWKKPTELMRVRRG